jgi:tetratricopeptide (TPR) repeat protein
VAGSNAPRDSLLEESGRYERAMCDLNRAIALGLHDPLVYVTRAIIHDKLKLYEEYYLDNERSKWCSAAWLERTEKTNDALSKGRSCLKKGEYDAAVALFSKAVYLDPGHTQALLQRASAYRRLGRAAEACSDYKKAVAILVREARHPRVFIVTAVCQEGRDILRVYPDTARGYRRAKVFMERFREDKRLQKHDLPFCDDGEPWHLVDLELFKGTAWGAMKHNPNIAIHHMGSSPVE